MGPRAYIETPLLAGLPEEFRQKLVATLVPAQKHKLKAFEAARGWDKGRGMGRGWRGHGFQGGERQAAPSEG